MMSDFGQLLLFLRIEHGERSLANQANILGVTTASLSRIVRGDMAIPSDWPAKIQAAYHLTPEQYDCMIAVAKAGESLDVVSERPTTMVGALINGICEEQGITVKEIAKRTGVSWPYIMRLCNVDEDRLSLAFVEMLKNEFLISPEKVDEVETCLTLNRPFTLKGRTLKQRSLAFFVHDTILTVPEEELAGLKDRLTAISKDKEIRQYSTPMNALLKRTWPEYYLQINNGERFYTLTEEELEEFSLKCSVSEFDMYGVRHINRISSESIIYQVDARITKAEHLVFLKAFLDTLPYMSDADADMIYAELWRIRHVRIARQSGSKLYRAGRSSLPRTPAARYLAEINQKKRLFKKSSDEVEALGIGDSSYQRFVCGKTAISYDLYLNLCRTYKLSALEEEMFRCYAEYSRRGVVLDMFCASTEKRAMLCELQRSLLELNDSQCHEILKLIRKSTVETEK